MARDYPDSFDPTVPVDRVAARVISKGIHHQFAKRANSRDVWERPPNTIPLPLVPEVVKPLLGERKGALVVVGYLGRKKSGGGGSKAGKDRGHRRKSDGRRLLVRCDCGRYETRIASRWREHDAVESYCQFCERREKLKLTYLSFPERDRVREIERRRLTRP